MAVSNTAEIFSSLFGLFLWLAVIVGAVVFGVMAYFIVKYREKDPSAPEPEDAPTIGKIPQARGKPKTLLTSLSLSTIILVVLVIGVPGVVIGTFQAIDTISSPPEGTLKISVIGQRFAWSFVYPNGFQDSILRVPIGEVVILNVTSTDVFHNFGIIDFRIKIDAIPGRLNTIWFEAKELGEYRIQCFEFCGVGHFTMISTVIVMEPEEYHRWYSSLEVKT